MHAAHKNRIKIAAERIEQPLHAGGLGIWNPCRRAISSFLSAFVNTVAFIHKAYDSNLAKICVNSNISLYKYMLALGSASFKGPQIFFKVFYPRSTVENLHIVRDTVESIEKHPLYFFRASTPFNLCK